MMGAPVTSIPPPPVLHGPKPFAFDPNDSTPKVIACLFVLMALVSAATIPCAMFATAIVGVDFEGDDVPVSAFLALVPTLGLLVVSYVQAPIRLALAVGFLIWVHGVRKNLDVLGAQGLSFSPGWSVGAFFVPVLNLLVPYQVVNEVWRASEPTRVDEPFAWKNVNSSPRVSTWWLAFLLGNGFAVVSDRAYVEGNVAAERAALWLLAGGNAFLFLAASLGAWMVLGIRSRQRERFIRLRIAADLAAL